MATFSQSFFTSRKNNANGQEKIGEVGRLWYEPETNTIRVSDGATPGGVIVGGNGSGNGYVGSRGVTGYVGSRGVTSYIGSQGSLGYVGSQGNLGYVGSQGNLGYSGSFGFTGSQGNLSYVGSQGNLGYSGSFGFTGSQGIQGDAGGLGYTGSAGAGYTGSQGTAGYTGSQGAPGQSSNYYRYNAKVSSTSGNPGNGFLIWNTSTQRLATQINLSHLDRDNNDIDVFLALLNTGDTLIIQDQNNSDNYQIFNVSSTATVYPNSYVEVPVTAVSSTGTGYTNFSGGHDLLFIIQSAGVQGPIGYTGSDGVGYTGSSYSFNTSTLVAQAVTAISVSNKYVEITTSTSAVIGQKYIVDTSNVSITVTLPGSGTIGDEITIIDGSGNASTHAIILNRNGGKIQGIASNMNVTTDRAAFTLVYYNSANGWILTNV